MIEIVKELKEANCVTHGGKFHSDEIFATVILSKILTNIKLIRVNEVTDSMRESIANKLVYDIGGGEFDHHQAGGNGQRDNGVKYASCGLIWKSYGKKYLEKCNVKKEHIEELFLQIDKDLIQYIDANDNGQSTKIDTDYKLVELASVISAFNPCWNETVDTDECFMQAYEIAKKYFERFIAREIAKNEAKELVENAIENSKEGIMILEDEELRDKLDIKIYVDTEDDIRILRRIQRDIKERGRTVDSVIEQYLSTVKPAHDQFIEPYKKYADIIMPEGGQNEVAIDIVITKIKTQLN